MLRQLETIATALKLGHKLSPLQFEEPEFTMLYNGFIQAKERPRSRKGSSSHYTPTATVKFEAAVALEAAKIRQAMGMELPYRRPVKMDITIYDEFPEKWTHVEKVMALGGMVFPTDHGDLDNKVKAVWDALNKVVYQDDKLIVYCDNRRKYWHYDGFKVVVQPVGLTKREIEIVQSLMK